MRFILAVCFLVGFVFANDAVTPGSLWKDFQADANAFRAKHEGKKITISGVVEDTHISVYLTSVVSLVDKKGEEVRVICVLPSRTDAPKLSNFKTGSTVKMIGNFYSAREEKIVIKQCEAVK